MCFSAFRTGSDGSFDSEGGEDTRVAYRVVPGATHVTIANQFDINGAADAVMVWIRRQVTNKKKSDTFLF